MEGSETVVILTVIVDLIGYEAQIIGIYVRFLIADENSLRCLCGV